MWKTVVYGLAAFSAVFPVFAGDLNLRFVTQSTTDLENQHDVRLAPDGSVLYVSDLGHDRIVALNPQSLDFVFSFGEADLSSPHDIDFDDKGRAYVADTHNNRVVIYEIENQRATKVSELKGKISGPEGVLIHPNGLTYVAGAWSNNVVVFKDGAPIQELTGLSSPHDLELAPDGNIWLADAGNDRMLLLSPQLVVIKELSGPKYGFDGVRYQDVMADGTLIAADKYNDRVVIIAPDGDVQGVLDKGHKPFKTPEGVEIQGDSLWISDSGNDRVLRFEFKP